MSLTITVLLFVTMAQLARSQTLVITVKIHPAGENSSSGKSLMLQFNPMCKKIGFIM